MFHCKFRMINTSLIVSWSNNCHKCTINFSFKVFNKNQFELLRFYEMYVLSLHCTLSLAAQCIVICPVCVWVCLWVCYHDNLKLHASIITKLGL